MSVEVHLETEARRKSSRNLRRERRRALLGGYFWMPCDICGSHFGGHERGGGDLLVSECQSRKTCPDCPGYWLRRGDRYIELVPTLFSDGSLGVSEVWGSSEWMVSCPRPREVPS